MSENMEKRQPDIKYNIDMSQATRLANPQETAKIEFNRLPSAARIAAARDKYAAAVNLYARTSLSIREIAEKTGLSFKAFSSYLSKHHRPLLYKRYGIEKLAENRDVKIKSPRGQSKATHLKYKEAIIACGDVAYVEYNVSQIARMFELSPTGLSTQLKVHYPEVIPAREAIRERLGLADGINRGAKASSKAAYEEAVPVYRYTDLSIQEVADRFGISKSGFGQYMRFYHHDAIADKALRRRNAKKVYHKRQEGTLSGNGRQYGPRKQTTELYDSALNLYKGGRKTIQEIVKETGVPLTGFKHYIDQWHREARANRKDTKYAEAIASIRENPRPVTNVSNEFGLNADVFREYLKSHAPELAKLQGMVRLESGKLVKKSAMDKYRPAIEEYLKVGGSLRSIALRHGITYNSLASFYKRTFGDDENKELKTDN